MSEPLPLVINFEGDYGMKMFMVDPAITVGELAADVRDQLVGTILKPLPGGAELSVFRNSDGSAVPAATVIGEAGFVKLEALDITWS